MTKTAYATTEVPVSRSQEAIRKLIMERKGSSLAIVEDPPREGFMAKVTIDGTPYQIRISIEPKTTNRTANQIEAERRRAWRVLYHHVKAVFVAADTGVMELRELLMPFIVTASGKTIAESILPRLNDAIQTNPARMLG